MFLRQALDTHLLCFPNCREYTRHISKWSPKGPLFVPLKERGVRSSLQGTLPIKWRPHSGLHFTWKCRGNCSCVCFPPRLLPGLYFLIIYVPLVWHSPTLPPHPPPAHTQQLLSHQCQLTFILTKCWKAFFQKGTFQPTFHFTPECPKVYFLEGEDVFIAVLSVHCFTDLCCCFIFLLGLPLSLLPHWASQKSGNCFLLLWITWSDSLLDTEWHSSHANEGIQVGSFLREYNLN